MWPVEHLIRAERRIARGSRRHYNLQEEIMKLKMEKVRSDNQLNNPGERS